jgi:hypothetical protein
MSSTRAWRLAIHGFVRVPVPKVRYFEGVDGVFDRPVEAGLQSITATAPEQGSLVRNKDGSYTYRPAAGFVGSDSFTYTVTDGTFSAPATIHLQVAAAQTDDKGKGASITIQSSLNASGASQDEPKVQYVVVNGNAGGKPADASVGIDWNANAPIWGRCSAQPRRATNGCPNC